MLTTIQDAIRTLIIPLQGRNLLLPNVAVAEVMPYVRPRAVVDAPEWLLGEISWRGLKIPLVSYDLMQGITQDSAQRQAQIVVINTVKPDGELKFYAMVTAGIPQLKRANQENLQELSADAGEGMLSQVQIADVTAVIPDLNALETTVEQCWQQVAA